MKWSGQEFVIKVFDDELQNSAEYWDDGVMQGITLIGNGHIKFISHDTGKEDIEVIRYIMDELDLLEEDKKYWLSQVIPRLR